MRNSLKAILFGALSVIFSAGVLTLMEGKYELWICKS